MFHKVLVYNYIICLNDINWLFHSVTDSVNINWLPHSVTDSVNINWLLHSVTDSVNINWLLHSVTDSVNMNWLFHSVTDSVTSGQCCTPQTGSFFPSSVPHYKLAGSLSWCYEVQYFHTTKW